MSVTSIETVQTNRRLGAWAVQGVVAAIFLAAGGAKLAGAPIMIQLFDQIGLGQWFRIVTGVVEIIGAFALIYPGLAAIGGLWLGFTMLCAAATDLLVLHTSPLAAVILGSVSIVIVHLRYEELQAIADDISDTDWG